MTIDNVVQWFLLPAIGALIMWHMKGLKESSADVAKAVKELGEKFEKLAVSQGEHAVMLGVLKEEKETNQRFRHETGNHLQRHEAQIGMLLAQPPSPRGRRK